MRTLFLSALLLLSTASFAQLGIAPEISIGASNMRFIPDNIFRTSAENSQLSWRVGAILDAPFTSHTYFQTGLYYSRKGHNRNYSYYDSDSSYDHEDRTFTLNYIDLPLNVVFKTSEQGKGRLCIGAGAMLSYLISGDVKGTSAVKIKDTLYSNNISANPGDLLRKFDIGASFFAAYEFPTGLYLKAYYVSGVKDIGTLTEISKNRVWGLSIGYMFGKDRNVNKDKEGLIDKGE